jgi:hypothetical protein
MKPNNSMIVALAAMSEGAIASMALIFCIQLSIESGADDRTRMHCQNAAVLNMLHDIHEFAQRIAHIKALDSPRLSDRVVLNAYIGVLHSLKRFR